jgi:hypothetical protein
VHGALHGRVVRTSVVETREHIEHDHRFVAVATEVAREHDGAVAVLIDLDELA